MRFNTSHAVTISLDELEKLLPESAVKLITDECHVDSICDLYLQITDSKTLN